MTKIMLVDDEEQFHFALRKVAERQGYEFCSALDGESGFAMLVEQRPDILLLDVMMPGMDGFELCTRARTITDIPIMFLTAKDGEADQVVGFTLGADDYVTKPFKPRELVARVKARIRRFKRDNGMAPDGVFEGSEAGDSAVSVLEVRGLEVDPRTHKAFLYDVPLELTPKEFAILQLLLERVGEPVSAQDLYETVWQQPYDAGSSNTVMVHIRHLRKKLADIDSSTSFIETAWGVGYYIAREGNGASHG